MSAPINLEQINEEDFKEFLDSFDHVFSDCDGVIWAKTPLPGSGDFVNLMKKLNKTVHFVSNNSLRTENNYRALFQAADIDNGFEKLTIPSIAIAEYFKSINLDKHIYCVACPETIRILESFGLNCKYGPDDCADSFTEYIQYTEDDPSIGAVVFDSDFKVNIPKMYKAISYLSRPEVSFVNGATDKHISFRPGSLMLGTGMFAEIVAQESKRTPILLGKPGKLFGEFAMKRAGVKDPSRVLFIGDMIDQDVALGKNTGFKTLLVLTNITEENMLAHKTIKPDFFAKSLGHLVPFLKKYCK